MTSQSRRGPLSKERVRASLAAVVILTLLLASTGLVPIRAARGASQSPTPIRSCRTIDSPGAYTLTRDITTERDSCIEITANDVVLDGNQHAVTGNESGAGISVDGSSSPITNVTVRNITATDWDRGISYENASGSTISHAIASGNREGIALEDSNRVRVLNSTTTSNRYGIYLNATTDSEIRGSTAKLNRWGVVLEGDSTRNTIARTISTDNSQWDLHSREGSANNRLVEFDVGSGTFSLSSTNVRARGSVTGENVFTSPPTAPRGWNDTGSYIEIEPTGNDSIQGLTAAYTGQAGTPSSLALWHYANGSWSKLPSEVNARTHTVSAGPIRNGTIALFAKSDRSIGNRALDHRNDTDRTNTSSTSPIVLRQGEKCYPLSALGNGSQSVQDFYGYRTPYTSPDNPKGWYQAYGAGANRLERANTSQVFLYRGTNGLSLVFLHDGRSNSDGSGGTVTANIAGLPESGNWTVQDDHYHQQDDVWAVAPGRSKAHVEWVWNFGNRSDGGAFTGLGNADWQRITIEMAFNERSALYPFEAWTGPPESNHVDRWIARSGTRRTYRLDMNRSVTLERGSCSAAGTSPSQQTTGVSGSGPATTDVPSTGSDTPSDSVGLLSSIAETGRQELVGLGVLLVALVAVVWIVFRR